MPQAQAEATGVVSFGPDGQALTADVSQALAAQPDADARLASQRISRPRISKYERARAIGVRAHQLA